MDDLVIDFTNSITKIKENIDVDKDGMVSVAETYGFVKTTFKMILKMIKSWF